jgi:hypothetical protein
LPGTFEFLEKYAASYRILPVYASMIKGKSRFMGMPRFVAVFSLFPDYFF